MAMPSLTAGLQTGSRPGQGDRETRLGGRSCLSEVDAGRTATTLRCSRSPRGGTLLGWALLYTPPPAPGQPQRPLRKRRLHLHFTGAGDVRSLGQVRLSGAPWAAARQASLSFTNSRSLLKLMSIESVTPSISSSVVPFSSQLQSFPASRSFPMRWLSASGGQSTGPSASTLPMNIQD